MKPRFMLTIEAAPQANDADGTRRLRAALKSMLRRHGLRCLTVAAVADARNDGEAIRNQEPTAASPEK